MTSLCATTTSTGAMCVIEPMTSASSAAIICLLPVGSAGDSDDQQGASPMLAEMLLRGAGDLDSRAFSDALDRLGVQRSSALHSRHLSIEMVMLGAQVSQAIPFLIDMIRRPALPPDSMEPVRQLCLQSLSGLRDDPQHLTMVRLRERHMPAPFNRHAYGQQAALEALTIDDLKQNWTARCAPGGSIIAVAGDIDSDAISATLDRALDGWQAPFHDIDQSNEPLRGIGHDQQDTAQAHIGIAWDAPPEPDPDSMIERLAIAVLSGGMSGRLFTEVRERRSLCYAVGARYVSGRDFGFVQLYAGTTPDRAQETVDVSLAEVQRLAQGVTEEEFHRAVVGLKSRLVMQGESTAARAGAIAGDQYRVGRPRSLDEIAAAVDAITLDQLNAYLAERNPGEFTLHSIGPSRLALPE